MNQQKSRYVERNRVVMELCGWVVTGKSVGGFNEPLGLKMVKVAIAYRVVLGVPEIRKKVKDEVDCRMLGFAWVLQQKPC